MLYTIIGFAILALLLRIAAAQSASRRQAATRPPRMTPRPSPPTPSSFAARPTASMAAAPPTLLLNDPPAPEQSLAACVELLLENGRDPSTVRTIIRAGSAAAPSLIAALSDPRFARAYAADRVHDLGRHFGLAPLHLALHCLSIFAPPQAAAAAAPLIGSADPEVRRRAAELLALIGSRACADPLIAAIESDEAALSDAACRTIEFSARDGRIMPALRAALVPALTRRIHAGSDGISCPAAGALVALDPDEGRRILTSPRILQAPRRDLSDLLHALRRHGMVPPLDTLLDALGAVTHESPAPERERALEACLELLAGIEDAPAEEALRRMLESPSAMARLGAARALAARRGVHDPINVARERQGAMRWGAITPQQRHVLAVDTFIDALRANGFEEFFSRRGWDGWLETPEALEAVGLHADAELVRDGLAHFGPAPLDLVGRAWSLQIEELREHAPSPFYVLDARAAGLSNIEREILLTLYITEHAEHFRDEGERSLS